MRESVCGWGKRVGGGGGTCAVGDVLIRLDVNVALAQPEIDQIHLCVCV